MGHSPYITQFSLNREVHYCLHLEFSYPSVLHGKSSLMTVSSISRKLVMNHDWLALYLLSLYVFAILIPWLPTVAESSTNKIHLHRKHLNSLMLPIDIRSHYTRIKRFTTLIHNYTETLYLYTITIRLYTTPSVTALLLQRGARCWWRRFWEERGR